MHLKALASVSLISIAEVVESYGRYEAYGGEFKPVGLTMAFQAPHTDAKALVISSCPC